MVCKNCGKTHKEDEKEEYVEEKEIIRDPFPYDPAPSDDKKSKKCNKCGKVRKNQPLGKKVFSLESIAKDTIKYMDKSIFSVSKGFSIAKDVDKEFNTNFEKELKRQSDVFKRLSSQLSNFEQKVMDIRRKHYG